MGAMGNTLKRMPPVPLGRGMVSLTITSSNLACFKRAPIGTVHQAVALAETNIHHTVRALQETHGIPVGLIAAERDTLYPIYRRMGKVSKETGIPRDQMTVIPGTHITHLEDAKRVTSTINDMFLMLRKKRRGEQNGKSDVGGKSLV
jgi:pimeloyl-ACP methyl ester carboxylesterase